MPIGMTHTWGRSERSWSALSASTSGASPARATIGATHRRTGAFASGTMAAGRIPLATPALIRLRDASIVATARREADCCRSDALPLSRMYELGFRCNCCAYESTLILVAL